MKCVRGTVLNGLGEPPGIKEQATFVGRVMGVVVEGALATPSADVEHFPCRPYQIGPNNPIRIPLRPRRTPTDDPASYTVYKIYQKIPSSRLCSQWTTAPAPVTIIGK